MKTEALLPFSALIGQFIEAILHRKGAVRADVLHLEAFADSPTVRLADGSTRRRRRLTRRRFDSSIIMSNGSIGSVFIFTFPWTSPDLTTPGIHSKSIPALLMACASGQLPQQQTPNFQQMAMAFQLAALTAIPIPLDRTSVMWQQQRRQLQQHLGSAGSSTGPR
uniref:Uncharacterized protein n=1 Tax=Globodera rostochiensis TaxID=31243 RepID=A0A914HPQ6_GLORO